MTAGPVPAWPAALLAGCGQADTQARRDAAARDGGDSALPAPESAGGPVTGMPDAPGPGTAPIAGGPPPDTPVASDGGLGPLPAPPDALAGGGTMPGDPGVPAAQPAPSSSVTFVDSPGGDGPTPADAVAVVRDYYAAINAGRHDRAYALWSDGGGASGQSAQQFARGFADTAGVSVEVQAPGRVDAAAGSRHIEVPVAIAATRGDGSVHRYVGSYVLRRSVVDGAGAEQRAWRIASADIREVQP